MSLLACTSIRSDFDLMRDFYVEMHNSHPVTLLACGAHLKEQYGKTLAYVKSTFPGQVLQCDTLPEGDDLTHRLISQGRLTQLFAKTLEQLRPELIFVVGDREDALALAVAAAYMEIPSVHFYGGDYASDGNVDNLVRDAISKLCTYHLVAHPSHQERLQALGETAERIFLVGSVALDRIKQHIPCSRAQLEEALKVCTNEQKWALLTFHPIATEREVAPRVLRNIVDVLLAHHYFIFINSPNSDPGNNQIRLAIKDVSKHQHVYAYSSLPNNLFLSLLNHCAIIIGNSSLGIYEAASIPVGVVNVGLRQRGRLADQNVVFVEATKEQISQGVQEVASHSFQAKLRNMSNSYGDGASVQRAAKVIREIILTRQYKAQKPDPLTINIKDMRSST